MRALANYLAFRNPGEENEMSLGKKFMDEFPELLQTLPGRPEMDGDFVFDAAPFGQYFGGIDPRNGNSSPGFVNRDAPFFPNLFFYQMENVGGKNAIAVFGTGRWKRIAVLHIHSKILSEFSSARERFRGNELM